MNWGSLWTRKGTGYVFDCNENVFMCYCSVVKNKAWSHLNDALLEKVTYVMDNREDKFKEIMCELRHEMITRDMVVI